MWHHFFPLLFPKDSESLKIFDIWLREVGAKRPLNGTSKVWQTYGHIDLLKASAQRADALKILFKTVTFHACLVYLESLLQNDGTNQCIFYIGWNTRELENNKGNSTTGQIHQDFPKWQSKLSRDAGMVYFCISNNHRQLVEFVNLVLAAGDFSFFLACPLLIFQGNHIFSKEPDTAETRFAKFN